MRSASNIARSRHRPIVRSPEVRWGERAPTETVPVRRHAVLQRGDDRRDRRRRRCSPRRGRPRCSSSTTGRPTAPATSSPRLDRPAGAGPAAARTTRARARRSAGGSPRRPSDYVIVQDADLEYDPGEYGALVQPLERGPGRRGLRLALHLQPAPPGPVLLALGRQPVPHHAVQHVHQPEPHRHGDLLQGLPPRGHPVAPASRRTASASSPRSPPRWPGPGGGSTRWASATTAAPTPRARRSAGATACGPCGASSSTRGPASGAHAAGVGPAPAARRPGAAATAATATAPHRRRARCRPAPAGPPPTVAAPPAVHRAVDRPGTR